MHQPLNVREFGPKKKTEKKPQLILATINQEPMEPAAIHTMGFGWNTLALLGKVLQLIPAKSLLVVCGFIKAKINWVRCFMVLPSMKQQRQGSVFCKGHSGFIVALVLFTGHGKCNKFDQRLCAQHSAVMLKTLQNSWKKKTWSRWLDHSGMQLLDES